MHLNLKCGLNIPGCKIPPAWEEDPTTGNFDCAPAQTSNKRTRREVERKKSKQTTKKGKTHTKKRNTRKPRASWGLQCFLFCLCIHLDCNTCIYCFATDDVCNLSSLADTNQTLKWQRLESHLLHVCLVFLFLCVCFVLLSFLPLLFAVFVARIFYRRLFCQFGILFGCLCAASWNTDVVQELEAHPVVFTGDMC